MCRDSTSTGASDRCPSRPSPSCSRASTRSHSTMRCSTLATRWGRSRCWTRSASTSPRMSSITSSVIPPKGTSACAWRAPTLGSWRILSPRACSARRPARASSTIRTRRLRARRPSTPTPSSSSPSIRLPTSASTPRLRSSRQSSASCCASCSRLSIAFRTASSRVRATATSAPSSGSAFRPSAAAPSCGSTPSVRRSSSTSSRHSRPSTARTSRRRSSCSTRPPRASSSTHHQRLSRVQGQPPLHRIEVGRQQWTAPYQRAQCLAATCHPASAKQRAGRREQRGEYGVLRVSANGERQHKSPWGTGQDLCR
mmetsp:Transcript_47196/g.123824  ORF Transcript_47196/g.123824 Transcript_47196/m.123824 type:complete len:312 (+) Transcript_47196:1113-2048(+)